MTNEVLIREVQDSDLPVFFEQQLDPDAVRMADFPSRAHDAFMAHWAKNRLNENNIHRTVLYGGEVAGNIVSWEVNGEREIGYWFGKEYWGKGIATAALKQFLAEVNIRPLHAFVVTHNIGSLRVLQKCGFVFSGNEDDEGYTLILTE